MSETPCPKCEWLLQLYLDGELSEDEAREAEVHLDNCGYCRPRYRFERAFREYMRKTLCEEPMSPELRVKLVALRSSTGPVDRS
ncbi:MAG TPA: zf-HC2 domain-containing protein [Gaiellaceae bacterium]